MASTIDLGHESFLLLPSYITVNNRAVVGDCFGPSVENNPAIAEIQR